MARNEPNESLACEKLIIYPFIGFALGCLILFFLLSFEQWRAHEAFRPLIAEGEVKFTVTLSNGKEEELTIKPSLPIILNPIDGTADEMAFILEELKRLTHKE